LKLNVERLLLETLAAQTMQDRSRASKIALYLNRLRQMVKQKDAKLVRLQAKLEPDA
jgi:hypothetical protein